MAGGRLRPYLGVGYNRLQPRFQVNFTNQFGQVDTTRVAVNLNRGVAFGGATWQAAARLGVTAEIYAAPADAVTARVIVRTAIGPN
jgi:outer membrane protein W